MYTWDQDDELEGYYGYYDSKEKAQEIVRQLYHDEIKVRGRSVLVADWEEIILNIPLDDQ